MEIIKSLLSTKTVRSLTNSLSKRQTKLSVDNGGDKFSEWINITLASLKKDEQQFLKKLMVALNYFGEFKDDDYIFSAKITDKEIKYYEPGVMGITKEGNTTVIISFGSIIIPVTLTLFQGDEPVLDLLLKRSGDSDRLYLTVNVQVDGEFVTVDLPIFVAEEHRQNASMILKKITLLQHLRGVKPLPKGFFLEKNSNSFPVSLEKLFLAKGEAMYNITEAGSCENFKKNGFNQWVKVAGDPTKYLLKPVHCGEAFDNYKMIEGATNYTLEIKGAELRKFKDERGVYKEYTHIFASVTFDLEDGDNWDVLFPSDYDFIGAGKQLKAAEPSEAVDVRKAYSKSFKDAPPVEYVRTIDVIPDTAFKDTFKAADITDNQFDDEDLPF